MIPVIGIPYITRPDLLADVLSAIRKDQVGRIHIIDNSAPDLSLRVNNDDPQLCITRMHRNIGVSAAWNIIMKANPMADWWCILNSDVILTDSDLPALEAAMENSECVLAGGMYAFGIKPSAIQKVGWFDESYVPAYCEDIDWVYRAKLLGVNVEQIPGFLHFGSHAIKSNPHFVEENRRSYPQNRRYYERKWGGFVGEEAYTTPFDAGGSPRDWTLDMDRLRDLTWKE